MAPRHPNGRDLTVDLRARAELEDLLSRFSDAISCVDRARFLELWAADGEWSVPGMSPARGREAIGRQFDDVFTVFPQVVQLVSYGVLEPAGDGVVHGRRHMSEFATNVDGRTSQFVGFYDDEIVRTDQRWRFRRRTFHMRYRIWLDEGGKRFPISDTYRGPLREA